jgi:hypothetical protein
MADKRDLLIHYDEAARKLTFQPVPSASASALRASVGEGVSPDLDDLADMNPDDAEQHVGRLVLALVDLHSDTKIGIRDYEAEAAAEQARYVAALEDRVAAGDADAQFELFVQLQIAALKTFSLPALERADALLAAAAAQGHEEALAMCANWPAFRAVAERRIARHAAG